MLQSSTPPCRLSASCTVSSAKKRDLTLLKNWSPVALLCMYSKVLSPALANTFKDTLDNIMHMDHNNCVPEKIMMDNI